MRNPDGTFKEGVSGNPEGKPRGAISTKTKEWHAWGEYIVGETMPLYVQNLDDMMASGDERVRQEAMKRFESILEYFKPKLSRSDVDISSNGEKVDIPISTWANRQE